MLILQARVAAGWIDASELPQAPEEDYEDTGYAEGEYDADAVFGDAPEAEATLEGDEGLEEAALEGDDAEVFAEDLEQSRDA